MMLHGYLVESGFTGSVSETSTPSSTKTVESEGSLAQTLTMTGVSHSRGSILDALRESMVSMSEECSSKASSRPTSLRRSKVVQTLSEDEEGLGLEKGLEQGLEGDSSKGGLNIDHNDSQDHVRSGTTDAVTVIAGLSQGQTENGTIFGSNIVSENRSQDAVYKSLASEFLMVKSPGKGVKHNPENNENISASSRSLQASDPTSQRSQRRGSQEARYETLLGKASNFYASKNGFSEGEKEPAPKIVDSLDLDYSGYIAPQTDDLEFEVTLGGSRSDSPSPRLSPSTSVRLSSPGTASSARSSPRTLPSPRVPQVQVCPVMVDYYVHLCLITLDKD
jgi:hypothetical protein